MTLVFRTTPPAAHRGPVPPRRDTTIDAVRAGCLLIVVVLHALMVGVETTAEGAVRTSVALVGQPWFVPLTWVMQVMPLFFIAGGFAALTQWRRLRGQGATAADYVRARTARLAAPTLTMLAVVGIALMVARIAGADTALLDEVSLRVGQPLWFLAVYLGATALVPVMSRLHDRHPRITLTGLALAALLIDLAAREWSGAIGYANLALVWLFMQQLGFVMRDGMLAHWSRRSLCGGIAASLALLTLLVACGWSADMLENLNPPTLAMAVLGCTQLCALQLARPTLDRLTGSPAARRLIGTANGASMGIYLWHMPVMMALVGVLVAMGADLPAPHSVQWWATRGLWLAAVAVGGLAVVRCACRLEPMLMRAMHVGMYRWGSRTEQFIRLMAQHAGVLVLCAIAGTVIALLVGVSAPVPAAMSVTLLGVAALGGDRAPA